VRLDALAKRLGVKGIYVKDESHRFGLNAFKVLGGSYAMAKYIAGLTGRDVSERTYERLTSKELRDEIGQVTFFTATDGNHGRGVAWAANKLGQKSVIFMPAGSSLVRLEKIRAEGAEATIIDGNYDDAVRMAAAESAKIPNSVVVQDTAWEGYEEIPSWIMQGYGTLAVESERQLEEYGAVPSHIFVQAGVGSMAGAMQGYFSLAYGGNCPTVTVMEPQAADCIYRSAKAKSYQTIGGDLSTLMAGLSCGEPNTISWEILKNHSDFFASVPDWVAAKGMRVLSSPLPGDERVVSGESGAVGAGFLAVLMGCGDFAAVREQMGLDENSVVLLISTEGDTDPDVYRDIVWNGKYASC
jgi:diaminopropionate ammonia-lyase